MENKLEQENRQDTNLTSLVGHIESLNLSNSTDEQSSTFDRKSRQGESNLIPNSLNATSSSNYSLQDFNDMNDTVKETNAVYLMYMIAAMYENSAKCTIDNCNIIPIADNTFEAEFEIDDSRKSDATAFLHQVKERMAEHPQYYEEFINFLHLKARKDTSKYDIFIDLVYIALLFQDYQDLIEGYNEWIGDKYKINVESNGQIKICIPNEERIV